MYVDFFWCQRNNVFRASHHAQLAALTSVAINDYGTLDLYHNDYCLSLVNRELRLKGATTSHYGL